jgi:hypothetical protein
MDVISLRRRWFRFAASVMVFGTALAQAGYVKHAIAQSQAAADDSVPAAKSPAEAPKAPSADNATLEKQLAKANSEDQSNSPSSDNLASLVADSPNMFGDFWSSGGNISVQVFALHFHASATSSIPLAGGCGRLDVADDNNAVTQDRVYFLYNRFDNAMNASGSANGQPPQNYTFSPDTFTLGIEKTSSDGLWSIEARLCGANMFDFSNSAAGAGVSGGQFGDLGIIVKRMIYQSQTMALSLGLGVGTPTGCNADGNVEGYAFKVNNQTVNLLPFVAISGVPQANLFYQGFFQVDVPTNGNPIDSSIGPMGSLYEQTLLHLDFEAGYWLFRNRDAHALTGLASIVELHYTSALQGAQSSFFTYTGPTSYGVTYSSAAGEVSIVDLTVGLHAELARQTLVRVGASFPLGTNQNRTFDSELLVQLERKF